MRLILAPHTVPGVLPEWEQSLGVAKKPPKIFTDFCTSHIKLLTQHSRSNRSMHDGRWEDDTYLNICLMHLISPKGLPLFPNLRSSEKNAHHRPRPQPRTLVARLFCYRLVCRWTRSCPGEVPWLENWEGAHAEYWFCALPGRGLAGWSLGRSSLVWASKSRKYSQRIRGERLGKAAQSSLLACIHLREDTKARLWKEGATESPQSRMLSILIPWKKKYGLALWIYQWWLVRTEGSSLIWA